MVVRIKFARMKNFLYRSRLTIVFGITFSLIFNSCIYNTRREINDALEELKKLDTVPRMSDSDSINLRTKASLERIERLVNPPEIPYR